jgi:Ulp1 family protease
MNSKKNRMPIKDSNYNTHQHQENNIPFKFEPLKVANSKLKNQENTKSLKSKNQQELNTSEKIITKRINKDNGKISKQKQKKNINQSALIQCFNLNEKEKYSDLIKLSSKASSGSIRLPTHDINSYQSFIKTIPTKTKDDSSINLTSLEKRVILPVSGKISSSYTRRIIGGSTTALIHEKTPQKKLPLQDSNLNSPDLIIINEIEAREKPLLDIKLNSNESYLQKSALISNRILAPTRKLTRQSSEFERTLDEKLKTNYARLESILAKCNQHKKTTTDINLTESRYMQIKRQRLEEENKLARQFSERLQLDHKNISKYYIEELFSLPEENEFPELTDDQDACVTRWLNAHPQDEVLASAFNINITRKDIQSLKGLNWLNDEIINFYMNLIATNAKGLSVYPFTTFFYTKLIKEGYNNALKRWTRKVDIFSYDLLLVPIHLGLHWTLAVVDFKQNEIRYYDSMNGYNNECLKALCNYLKQEHMDKKKSEFDLNEWNAYHVRDIPQQMNGSDCGMFACKFADWLCRKKTIFTFNQVGV